MAGRTGAGTFDLQEAERMALAEIDRARAFYGEDGAGAAPLLPILHALQEAFGYIDPAAQPMIARLLNISQAEVRGVMSFYHDFRTEPGARATLKLCMAEACQARGVNKLAAYLETRYGLVAGAAAPDGKLAMEAVYCLGNCALGPAALLGDALIGALDELRVDDLVAEARR
jgi:formate dehydrogenase subunit gamma